MHVVVAEGVGVVVAVAAPRQLEVGLVQQIPDTERRNDGQDNSFASRSQDQCSVRSMS